MEKKDETVRAVELREIQNHLGKKLLRMMHKYKRSYVSIDKIPFKLKSSRGSYQSWIFLQFDPFSLRCLRARLIKSNSDIPSILATVTSSNIQVPDHFGKEAVAISKKSRPVFKRLCPFAAAAELRSDHGSLTMTQFSRLIISHYFEELQKRNAHS